MTIGIYKLNFPGTDKVYIGQSVNIEKRYTQHKLDIVTGRASSKMLEAYKVYGLPELEILCECASSELDNLEEEAIQVFNSVDNGFNTFTYCNEAPVFKGPDHGNAKFSKAQIIAAAEMLANPIWTFSEIEKKTKVSIATIASISSLSVHIWLSEEYPEIFNTIASLKNTRLAGGAIRRGDKISAKNRGIVYPKIKSPDGELYTVENAYAFARQHGLRGNHLTEVLNGHRKSHMGWKVCQEEQV